MRKVEWTDERGYRFSSLIRDSDPDEMAAQGVLTGPPTLEELDWAGIKRDLHNGLMDAGLFTSRDLSEKRGLRGAILSAMRKRLIYLYREAEHE